MDQGPKAPLWHQARVAPTHIGGDGNMHHSLPPHTHTHAGVQTRNGPLGSLRDLPKHF